MDSDSDNVAETEKYAFLLGSALRNEDTEQFFSVYDSILPCDLPDSQVEYIKDKARVIADLSEGQFSELVSRARHFSLAPAGKTMSFRPAASSPGWSFNSEDDEDEGVGGSTRLAGSKSETSSQYSITTTKVSARSVESDTRRYDEDSGVCNSSKATNSIGSLSDHDASDSDDRMHFDYFPTSADTQVKIRSGGGLYGDFDEIHDVESDRSSQCVNSPRSEISDDMGEEMTTFRHSGSDDRSYRQSHQDDFYTDEDSEEEEERNRAYKQFSSQRGYTQPVHFDPLEIRNSQYKPKFDQSRASWAGGKTTSTLRNVDDKISFNLRENRSQYSRYSQFQTGCGRSSSEHVKIETNSYPKSKPPFGSGSDQLDKVASSIGPLIKGFPKHEVENMPAGRKLELLRSEDTKKKKKKNKRGKDEPSDKYEKGGEGLQRLSPCDENGNPVESKTLIPDRYRQMRESPTATQGGAVNSGSKIRSYGATNNQHENIYSNSENGPFYTNHKDLENGSISSQEKTRKPRKKTAKEKVNRSEDVTDYVGDKKTIDELVDFIDGNNVAARRGKKLVHTNSEDIPEKLKTAKKGKEKKQKSIAISASVLETKSKGENSTQSTSLEASCQEANSSMGNSGAKADCTNDCVLENGDISDVADSESIKDSLLKDKEHENDKKSKGHLNAVNTKSSKSVAVRETMSRPGEAPQAVPRKDSLNEASVPAAASDSRKKAGKNGKGSRSDKPEAGSGKGKPDTSVVSSKTSKTDPSSSMTEKMDHSAGKSYKSDPFSGKTNKPELSTSVMVKQKNAKNAKFKPSSPTIKDELSAIPTEDNTTPDESQAFCSINDSTLDDAAFIFTDIDVPLVPKEDEFRQVVGKKKKKASKETPQPNHYITSTGSKPFPRYLEDKRSGPRINNINVKKPTSSSYTSTIPTTMDSEARMRDLSPSAFPALIHDGRRNSTGEVPIPSEVTVKSQDDSDIESVKSLPATQGGRSESLLSPRLNMSYAKMAASPKPHGVPVSPGPDSAEAEEEEDFNRKVPLWKGSPTERRHSIGSRPNGKQRGTTEPVPQNLCLKTGSQELLTVEPGASKSDSSVTMGVTKDSSVCKTQSFSSVCEDKKQIEKEVNLTVNHTLAKVPVGCTPVLNSTASPKPVVSKDGMSNDRETNVQPTETDSRETTAKPEPKPRDASKSGMSVSHKPELPKSVSKQNSNNRKLKPRSVIFLDKRVTEVPENLGITFGFEPCTEKSESCDPKVVQGLSEPSSSPIVNASSSGEVYNDGRSDRTELSFTAKSPDSSSPPAAPSPPTSSSSSVIPLSPTETPPPESLQLTEAKLDAQSDLNHKLSHVGRLNGIVSTASIQCSPASHCPRGDDPAVTLALADAGIQFVSSDLSEVLKSTGTMGVVVYFGEHVVKMRAGAESQHSNGPTQFCGHVNYLPEGGEVKGQFNVADAVSYLYREWDKVEQLKKKEPNHVRVHNDSC